MENIMELKQQIIKNIDVLPEQALVAINAVVNEFITLISSNEFQNKAENIYELPYKRGCMKGKMWVADDFDAPLEDFKEYM